MELTRENWHEHATLTERGCFEWTGHRRPGSYGTGWLNGRQEYAHREVFALFNGHRPPAVLHWCDNRACIHPLHLIGGTQADNMRDMDVKGRRSPLAGRSIAWLNGERHPRTKLSSGQVSAIKALLATGERHGAVAARFGVSRPTVSRIAAGVAWRAV